MNTLIINNTGSFTHGMIHELFYKNNVADVKAVTIMPEFVEGHLIKRAYLEIDAWHETESAYNFIKEMRTRRGALMSNNEETSEFFVVKNTTIKIQQTGLNNNNNNKNNKYTQYFENISKQNVNAQISEYEAELEQFHQKELLNNQVDVCIPFNF
jgi:hypothetical protein